MTDDELNGDAQSWALALLRAFADQKAPAEIDELIADVQDRFPGDAARYLTASLAAIAATLLKHVADVTPSETEHGLIDLIELGYHGDLSPTES